MERLKPESVYDKFVAFREGLGMEVLPASGGAVSAFTFGQRVLAVRREAVAGAAGAEARGGGECPG